MKIIALLTIPFIVYASATDVKEEVEFLKQRVQKLEEQAKNDAFDMSEIMPIVEAVERKSILDKINFSPELELRYDKMDYKVGDITGEDTMTYENGASTGVYRRKEYSKDFDIATLVRFKLNMSSKLDDNVKFNGRMIFAQSSQSNQRLCILSHDIKSNSASSAFDVYQAYFDYTSSTNSGTPFTFSFGVLPTTGGTPMQFAQNTQRKSMFPALVFNMNTYGVIGTQKISDDTYARAIIARAYTLRTTFYPYQCNRENIDNSDIMGVYFDTKFDFLGDSLLSFGVNMLHDLKAHPYLGSDVDSTNSHILGNMFTYGFGLDIKKVSGSNLTIFAHAALSVPQGNGQKDDYQIVANPDVNQTLSDGLTASGETGFSVADYASGEMLKENGHSIYIGARYDMSSSLNFGLEYNHGSKYWFSATQGAEDTYNKLATRGSVGEVYSNWNFHNNKMSAKIGYMYTEEQYTGSGWHFGEPADKDGIQRIAYLIISAKY